MTWTRGRVRMLELATWWTPLYMVLFLAVWTVGFFGLAGGGLVQTSAGSVPMGVAVIWAIIPLHLLTMVLGLVVLVAYAAHALNNERLEGTERLLWALLCFVGGFIGQLFYLYREIKPQLVDTA